MEIYQPSDDSYFFVDFLRSCLKKNRKISYLDMGTGSGILAETASEFLDKKNILAVDVNPDAVALVKKKGFSALKSDLFENVKGKFDLITFNAPYLPKDSREPNDSRVATTGGKKGNEIAIRFLKEAKKHLNSGGKILLLVSSLTPLKGVGGKVVARKKIFMEELRILEFG